MPSDDGIYAESELPCEHRRAGLTTVDCGCGRKDAKATIYECDKKKRCTLQETGITALRHDKHRVATCVGCEFGPLPA